MAQTCWLIGSIPNLSAQTVTINGNAHVITARSRYLYHPTANLSLLVQLQVAMALEVAGASVVLLRNRRVRISAAATFSLTWPADNVLRNLFGFTGNLAGSSAYTAPLISELLWSPGLPESPTMAPLGVVGHLKHQVFSSVSPFDGTRSTVAHGGRTLNEFKWQNVPTERVQTDAALAGEFATWWAAVGVRGSRWQLWRLVDEDGSSSPVSLSTSLGPYVCTEPDWKFARSAGLDWSDVFHPIAMPVEYVREYT
ncbi:hypothetical protein OV203_02430 [Nannocystis sp. ILAH1]|uniref:hypothetical protein n=1 Tax=Nannocystis sp. ILAH1 TaxID=2996789 RepID=UPI00226F9C19|nr:hypothetical protein [Nannocystis sp. ILAH1]MCY0985968.1 hypothetical protein [Nannocystis sp. ILAH1]